MSQTEFEKMKERKDELISTELTVVCSACGATCIYKREKNKVTFSHYCTPPKVRERIHKLRKLAWPWIPGRGGQITFEEWAELVRWVTETEIDISEAV